MRGNAVTFRADKKYDISWAGYFLPPAELEQYVQKIYEITEDGGLTYATVNTPCSNSEVINLYKQRENREEGYPGYMIVNKEIYRSYDPATKEEKNIDVKIVGASAPLPDESLRPGYDERNGIYPTILEKPVWEDTENRCVFKRSVHSIIHYMGPVFLKNLFENVGFQVERLSYLTAEGEVFPEVMTDEVLLNTVPLLGIKARKPVASSI